ncbi:interleukin 15, like isoform X2 [Osmerus mordax]|uniref:interleukin 15, like isoform X2 n=1 Tax=Osmerus mordax TaxID=8014 RepID=UPI00350F9A5F
MNRLHEAAHNRACIQQLSPRWRPMTGVSPVKVSGLGWRPSRLREGSLWLLCLAIFTVTLTDSDPICSRETIKDINNVLREVKMKPFDCNLYTPDLEDYENCPNSTLTCFADEAEVLMYEGAINKRLGLKRRLDSLKRQITKKDKDGCSQCEFYPEKAAEDFLTSLKSFLQKDCAAGRATMV